MLQAWQSPDQRLQCCSGYLFMCRELLLLSCEEFDDFTFAGTLCWQYVVNTPSCFCILCRVHRLVLKNLRISSDFHFLLSILHCSLNSLGCHGRLFNQMFGNVCLVILLELQHSTNQCFLQNQKRLRFENEYSFLIRNHVMRWASTQSGLHIFRVPID